MTRAPLVVWVILASTLLSLLQGYAVADGLASVEMDAAGTEHDCPGDVLPDSCPLHWASNDPATVGDDEFRTVMFVDEVRLTFYSSLGEVPATSFSLALQNLTIEHPVNRELNTTWAHLNNTRPDPTKSLVAFESRPRRTYDSDGSWTDGEWGLFFMLYPPATGPLAPVAWCWDFCSLDNQSYLHGSEDELRPFPNGGYVRDWTHDDLSTDGLVDWAFYEVPDCGNELLVAQCPDPREEPVINEAVQQYHNTTPQVTGGFQFNRTSVAVNTTADAAAREGRSGGLSVLSRGLQSLPTAQRLPGLAGPSWGKAQDAAPLQPPLGEREPREPAAPTGAPPTAVQGAASSRVTLFLTAGAATAILAVLGWLLYHRLSSREALDQETRRRIVQVVTARPGLRVATIASTLGVTHNTVKYHISRLEAWNLVRAGSGAQPGYFPTGKAPADAAAEGILVNPTVRAIHDALVARGELDHSALGAALGLHLSTVGRAVSRLEAAGLVTQTRLGRRVIVTLAKTSVGSPVRASGESARVYAT